MRERRRGLPPLVLLPGTLCDERVFTPLVTALRKSGAPAPLESAVIRTDHCDSIRSAAEHVLRVAPPRFALLGFSLGGIIALEVASFAPERLFGLALLNVNAAPAPEIVHAERRGAVLRAHSVGVGTYVRDELWAKYVGAASRGNQALLDLLASMAADLGHKAFHRQTEAALTRPDYRPLLPQITVPTLVLAGEDDAICPAAAQHEVSQALPNARFECIPGAGHFALLEQQDAVAASVAAWFHQLSGDAPSWQARQEKT